MLHMECNAPTGHEVTLSYGDYRWSYDRKQMAQKYAEIYSSDKRLIDRARWNDSKNGYDLVHTTSSGRHVVPISDDFIFNIRNHVERGLELNYFEHVFFPDMGHAHLLIPQSYYDSVVSKIPLTQQHDVYTTVLAHPETRFLYHTAEQLRMLDDHRSLLPDKYLGWRYFTRNLVGRNNSLGILEIHSNLDSIGNTVCEVGRHYRYWGAGFHLSANKDGCFSFTNNFQTYRFDISLSDLPTFPEDYGPLAHTDASSSYHFGKETSDLWGALGCLP